MSSLANKSWRTSLPIRPIARFVSKFGPVQKEKTASNGYAVEMQVEHVREELVVFKHIVAQFEGKVHGNVPVVVDSRTHNPVYYWNNIAASQLDARLLAKRVGLTFPERFETTIRR
jgi:hypothetical protein